MKKLLQFIILFSVYSCGGSKTPEAKVNVGHLKEYFIKTIWTDSTAVVDSFRLVKIDTTSAQNGYYFMGNKILDILDKNNNRLDELFQEEKKTLADYRLMADN